MCIHPASHPRTATLKRSFGNIALDILFQGAQSFLILSERMNVFVNRDIVRGSTVDG